MPVFRGPQIQVKRGRPDDLWFVSYPKSRTVVKYQGAWRSVMSPQEDFLNACDVVLRGGFVHEISTDLATELTTAGYGEFISED
jgi:hypothetical protein